MIIIMEHIYVLKLADNKYYVGKTLNIVTDIQNPVNDWCNKYRPVSLHHIVNSNNVNLVTLQYMSLYGMDNVRGGVFSNEILDAADVVAIQKIICTDPVNLDIDLKNIILNDIPHGRRNFIELRDGKFVHFTNDNRTNFDKYPVEVVVVITLYDSIDKIMSTVNKVMTILKKIAKPNYHLCHNYNIDYIYAFKNNDDLQNFIKDFLEEANRRCGKCYAIEYINGKYVYNVDSNDCLCTPDDSVMYEYDHICVRDHCEKILNIIDRITNKKEPLYCVKCKISDGYICYIDHKICNAKDIVDQCIEKLNNEPKQCYILIYGDGEYRLFNTYYSNDPHVCIMNYHCDKKYIDMFIDQSKIKRAVDNDGYVVYFETKNDLDAFIDRFLETF